MTHLARIVCVILALCLPVMMPVMATAHAQFNGSEPAPNALVLERPETVSLWFSEPVSPVAMRWISPDGESYPTEAEPGGKQVLVAPPPDAGDGSYLLAWRVVSLDGHPVSGILVISVGATSDIPTLSNITWPPLSAWALIVMKFALSVCLVLGIGGTVYNRFVATQTTPPGGLTLWALYLTFPAALFLVAAQGLDLLGLPLGAVVSSAPWTTGASTSIVRTAVLAALAAVTALILLRVAPLSQHRVAGPALACAAWGLAAISYAVSGHTATAEPEWQAVAAMIIHGLATVFWLGALLPLLALIRQGNDGLAELRRFSNIAMPLVGLLIVTGFFMASIHAGSGGFQALGMSGYGILLFIKLVSVIGLLLVAMHNRLVLTPAFNSGKTGAENALRGSIHVEIILALMIVAFASSFRLTPPPRTAAQGPQAQMVAVSQADVTAELQMSPSLVGPNEIKILVSKADGTSLEPIELTLGFSMSENDFGPIVVEASLGETGWSTQPFILPQPGEWDVDINLLVTDFDIVTLKAKVNVDP